MTGRTPFATLRNRMSPVAQQRARAKSEALEAEMALQPEADPALPQVPPDVTNDH